MVDSRLLDVAFQTPSTDDRLLGWQFRHAAAGGVHLRERAGLARGRVAERDPDPRNVGEVVPEVVDDMTCGPGHRSPFSSEHDVGVPSFTGHLGERQRECGNLLRELGGSCFGVE